MRGGIDLDGTGRRRHVNGSDEPLQRRAWPRGTRRTAHGCRSEKVKLRWPTRGCCADGVRGVDASSKKEV